jgi:hypothetical protein
MARTFTKFIRIRVSPDQFAQVEADAATYGKSLCAYGRDKLTGKIVKAKSDQLMLSEFRRIGGLIKHMRLGSSEIPEIVTALNRLADKL